MEVLRCPPRSNLEVIAFSVHGREQCELCARETCTICGFRAFARGQAKKRQKTEDGSACTSLEEVYSGMEV